MDTRRAFFGLVLGMAGAATVRRTGSAQTAADGQQGSQASGRQGGQAGDGDGLRDRGAPTGRTGAATRGARSVDGELALDLVAPLRGVGLTSVDQPALCYVLSGSVPGETAQPMRLAISTPGQARPLANLELPRAQPLGFGVIRLRDHGIRLAPNLLCVWSLTVALDPRAPARALVGSALIQHRAGDPALEAAKREVLPERRVAALARAGYWYDAVASAERGRKDDGGAALARLLEQEELRVAAGPGTGSPR